MTREKRIQVVLLWALKSLLEKLNLEAKHLETRLRRGSSSSRRSERGTKLI